MIRELESRISDGIYVRLLWHPDNGRVSITVEDTKTGEAFELAVRDGERALDVYRHPTLTPLNATTVTGRCPHSRTLGRRHETRPPPRRGSRPISARIRGKGSATSPTLPGGGAQAAPPAGTPDPGLPVAPLGPRRVSKCAVTLRRIGKVNKEG